MDCGNVAPLSNALEAHVARDGLPPEMMGDDFAMMGAEGEQDQLGGGCPMAAAPHPWEAEFGQMGPGPILGGAGPMAGMMQQHMDPESMMMDEQWGDAQAQHEAEMMEKVYAEQETAQDWIGQMEQHEGEEWAQDFNNEGVTTFTAEGQPLLTVEEKNKESKFYDFMNKIKTGEIVIDEGGTTSAPPGMEGNWMNEFQQNEGRPENMTAEELENWAKDHLNMMGQQVDENGELVDDEAMEGAMNEAWNGAEEMDEFGAEYFAQMQGQEGGVIGDLDPNQLMHGDEEGAEEWLNEYAEMNEKIHDAEKMTDYPFDPNNPYLFHENPFGEGQELLKAGNVSEAVLAFEAACQKDKSNPLFWQTLGTTQAENEKDMLAITALNTAKELDPSNLVVHMALSVSHTNEGNHTQALRSLKNWIKAHPEGDAVVGFVEGMREASGAPAQPKMAEEDEFSGNQFIRDFMFVSPSEHKDVVELYNAAIEMNPTDPELFIGMGILFNLSHEYDKAAKALEDALKLRPEDAKLWNKLGATLANGNRSREALAAYDKALDINPGYVRAQYNLGVSHSNLGEHSLAVRQFLKAIIMQQGGTVADGEPGSNRSTRELWDVLRMTFNLMERPDLVSLAWKQDCRPFLEEFELQEMM